MTSGAPCGSDPVNLDDPPSYPPREWAPVEHERVIAWRLHELLKAGYSVQTAELIAARTDIDLHRAVALVKSGCEPAVAGLILL